MGSEEEQLAAVFRSMGAEPKQAGVMAKQLLKRADQLAEQRGLSRVETLSELLDMVKSGRSGEAYIRGKGTESSEGN